jgi:hypothetical protein
MMLLPFVTLSAGLALAAAGRRGGAIALWAVSIAWMLLLFQLHASDALSLAF